MVSCCPSDTVSDDEREERVRGCTDMFWLSVYILFWISTILVAVFAFVYGNPMRLISGYDSFGNTCGSSSNEQISNSELTGIDTSNKKYLFYMDTKNIRESLHICVEKCPDENLNSVEDLEEFYDRTGSSLCRYDVNMANHSLSSDFFSSPLFTEDPLSVTEDPSSGILYGICPQFPVYKSKPVLNRCVPEVATDVALYLINKIYSQLNSWDFMEEVLSDVYRSWSWIIVFTILSCGLSLMVISLLHLLADIVAWIIMIVVSVAAVVVTGILWWTYIDTKCELDKQLMLNVDSENGQAFKWYAIIATVITVILLLMVFAMRKRISFLSALFKESSNCLAQIPALYFQPIISFVLLVVFYTFWISVVACLATANYPNLKPLKPYSDSQMSHGEMNKSDPRALNISVAELRSFTVVDYTDGSWVRYMWWLYVIGLFWTSEFILACQQMVIAGSVAKWYFSRGKNRSQFPVLSSIGNLWFYHLGSVALGSFLISIFKIPRIILTYLHARLRNKENNVCAELGMKSCFCCFTCLQKFIRYMNHNAYAIVAIQGINFCPASYRAWNVLMNNSLRLATVNSVGDFVLFLGKCIVTAITVSIAVIVFKDNKDLHFYAAPTFIVFVFSFFIAHSIISLYELVIDTMFLCICEDEEVDSSSDRWINFLSAKTGSADVQRQEQQS